MEQGGILISERNAELRTHKSIVQMEREDKKKSEANFSSTSEMLN